MPMWLYTFDMAVYVLNACVYGVYMCAKKLVLLYVCM